MWPWSNKRVLWEKLEFSRMANTRFSDWAADGSSPALSRRRGGPALRVQDARPQQRRESPRRRRYGCALLLFCEELLSLHRVQAESTRGLTVLTDHAGPTAAFTRASRSPSSRSTPGKLFSDHPTHPACTGPPHATKARTRKGTAADVQQPGYSNSTSQNHIEF